MAVAGSKEEAFLGRPDGDINAGVFVKTLS